MHVPMRTCVGCRHVRPQAELPVNPRSRASPFNRSSATPVGFACRKSWTGVAWMLRAALAPFVIPDHDEGTTMVQVHAAKPAFERPDPVRIAAMSGALSLNLAGLFLLLIPIVMPSAPARVEPPARDRTWVDFIPVKPKPAPTVLPPIPPAPRIELGGCAGLTRGPVCEVTEAARGLRAQDLRRPLVILATADEESSMDGARALVAAGRPLGRYAVIGEWDSRDAMVAARVEPQCALDDLLDDRISHGRSPSPAAACARR